MLSGIGDEARAARGQHPGTGALARGRQERAGPHPARRLPVRGARAVRVPQQRRQRVGLPRRPTPALELPDVSLVQIELPYASDVIAAQYPAPPNTWALCAGLVTPKSRGTVRLRSANPADRPIVDMRFLSHPDDVAALERSIEIARVGRGVGGAEAVRRPRGRTWPDAQGRGARGLRPQRGDDLLPLVRGLPNGQGRRGRGRLRSCASTACTICASPTAPSCRGSWPCRRCRRACSSVCVWPRCWTGRDHLKWQRSSRASGR